MEKIILLITAFALCLFLDPTPKNGFKMTELMRFNFKNMNQYIAHSSNPSDIKTLFDAFNDNFDMHDIIWINENTFKFKCSHEEISILKESNIFESLTFDLNLLVGWDTIIIHNQYK